jgi:transposase
VPALPSPVLEPLWVQIAVLLPSRQDTHPLGCHRPRIPDRVIFDKLIQVLVFGCGYRRIADHTCSATTLRRRRDAWITARGRRAAAPAGAGRLRPAVRPGTGPPGGGQLHHQGPCGGQTAGPSPVDRRKQGLKRSVATEAAGIPLAALAAPANHRDDGLLAATLDAIGAVGPLPPSSSRLGCPRVRSARVSSSGCPWSTSVCR